MLCMMFVHYVLINSVLSNSLRKLFKHFASNNQQLFMTYAHINNHMRDVCKMRQNKYIHCVCVYVGVSMLMLCSMLCNDVYVHRDA